MSGCSTAGRLGKGVRGRLRAAPHRQKDHRCHRPSRHSPHFDPSPVQVQEGAGSGELGLHQPSRCDPPPSKQSRAEASHHTPRLLPCEALVGYLGLQERVQPSALAAALVGPYIRSPGPPVMNLFVALATPPVCGVHYWHTCGCRRKFRGPRRRSG